VIYTYIALTFDSYILVSEIVPDDQQSFSDFRFHETFFFWWTK